MEGVVGVGVLLASAADKTDELDTLMLTEVLAFIV
jgi:hypothetical protein